MCLAEGALVLYGRELFSDYSNSANRYGVCSKRSSMNIDTTNICFPIIRFVYIHFNALCMFMIYNSIGQEHGEGSRGVHTFEKIIRSLMAFLRQRRMYMYTSHTFWQTFQILSVLASMLATYVHIHINACLIRAVYCMVYGIQMLLKCCWSRAGLLWHTLMSSRKSMK